jgi:hypothetical protein
MSRTSACSTTCGRRTMISREGTRLAFKTHFRLTKCLSCCRLRWSTTAWTHVFSGRSSRTVRRASADAATRQCYTCYCAAICMLKPAKNCDKRQAIGGEALRTCYEDRAVVRMWGRTSSWTAHARVKSRIWRSSELPSLPLPDWQTVSFFMQESWLVARVVSAETLCITVLGSA